MLGPLSASFPRCLSTFLLLNVDVATTVTQLFNKTPARQHRHQPAVGIKQPSAAAVFFLVTLRLKDDLGVEGERVVGERGSFR